MENTTVTGEYDIQLSFERLLGVHTEPSMGWGERIITRQSDKKFYSVAFSMMIRKLTPYLQNTLYMHGCHTNLSFGHHYGKAGVITYYFVRTRGCQKAVSLVWPGDHWLHWAQALPRGYTIRCHLQHGAQVRGDLEICQHLLLLCLVTSNHMILSSSGSSLNSCCQLIKFIN